MPELPEIEHLRRTLKPILVGAHVEDVRLFRPDIVRRGTIDRRQIRVLRRELLLDDTIDCLERRGKQLAILTNAGAGLCVQLGMTGQLRLQETAVRPALDHVHCRWRLRTAQGAAYRLLYRDPRRFGRLTPFASIDELRERWSALGPDASEVRTRALTKRLLATRRSIKAALMDQSVIAGLGNIYVDESLFLARLHPLTPANTLTGEQVRRLGNAIRLVLRRAIKSGGSTIRDYVDAQGIGGSFVERHAVYGRAEKKCLGCGATLRLIRVVQRSTVFCPRCQRLRQESL